MTTIRPPAPPTGGAGEATLTPVRQKIYDAITGSPTPHTVEELSAITGISSNTVGPRCDDLYRMGLIEPAGKAKTSTGRMASRWRAVPVDLVQLARHKAQKKPRRRKSLLDLSPEEQAGIVRALVRIDAVNAILLTDPRQSSSSTRARRESRSVQQRRRQLRDEIRKAEEDSSPLLKYLKAKRLIEDATEALRGMARNVFEEAELRAATGDGDIAETHWSDIRSIAIDHRTLAEAIVHEITGMLGEIEEDADIIDVEAIDDVDWELLPG